MKKLLIVFCIFMLSCSGGGGSSEPESKPETVAPVEVVQPVAPVVEPTIEKIPLDLTSEEWLSLDIDYTPPKPKFIERLVEGTPQNIVIMGTSLSSPEDGFWTKLFSDELTERFGDKANIVNLAIGGTNSEYGMSIIQDVIDCAPDVVFIEYAINDSVLSTKMSIEDSYHNLDHIVTAILEAYPDCEIIIETMSPSFRIERPDLADYYQTYRYYAASRGLCFIDYYPEWNRIFEDGSLKEIYLSDKTHPTLEATEAVIMPVLRKYVYME